MSQPSRPRISSDRHPSPPDGITRLHTACLTLMRTPPDLIRSMSLMVPLASFSISATSLVDLVERIAAEYGLIAKANLAESYLAARLLRSNGQADAPKHS